jgi:hypothetical protein
MTLDELKKSLAIKEQIKTQTEMAYQQILGQIGLLRAMIESEESKNDESKIEETPKE